MACIAKFHWEISFSCLCVTGIFRDNQVVVRNWWGLSLLVCDLVVIGCTFLADWFGRVWVGGSGWLRVAACKGKENSICRRFCAEKDGLWEGYGFFSMNELSFLSMIRDICREGNGWSAAKKKFVLHLCYKDEEVDIDIGEGILPDCGETPFGAEEIIFMRWVTVGNIVTGVCVGGGVDKRNEKLNSFSPWIVVQQKCYPKKQLLYYSTLKKYF